MELDLSNPFSIADWALRAYRDKDLEAYNQVLVKPATSTRVFKHARRLAPADHIIDLYFQDDDTVKIAAVVHPAQEGKKALYFIIVRCQGGFRVRKLKAGLKNPDLENSVEG